MKYRGDLLKVMGEGLYRTSYTLDELITEEWCATDSLNNTPEVLNLEFDSF